MHDATSSDLVMTRLKFEIPGNGVIAFSELGIRQVAHAGIPHVAYSQKLTTSLTRCDEVDACTL